MNVSGVVHQYLFKPYHSICYLFYDNLMVARIKLLQFSVVKFIDIIIINILLYVHVKPKFKIY